LGPYQRLGGWVWPAVALLRLGPSEQPAAASAWPSSSAKAVSMMAPTKPASTIAPKAIRWTMSVRGTARVRSFQSPTTTSITESWPSSSPTLKRRIRITSPSSGRAMFLETRREAEAVDEPEAEDDERGQPPVLRAAHHPEHADNTTLSAITTSTASGLTCQPARVAISSVRLWPRTKSDTSFAAVFACGAGNTIPMMKSR
jgi:hypothetical protein